MDLLMGKTLMMRTNSEKKKNRETESERHKHKQVIMDTEHFIMEMKIIWSFQIFFTVQLEHTSRTE